ncbi:hypothetical protein J7E91_28480 [Streptomyces sp. ISL-99]|uniref:hypothetical protein n=1 Tax=Streptomyces sp. ISL-99 TaxID=2819193 RepID=UPI001BEC3C04|nr:hypothetical protein [Streptomyces sp. ISL-99]MBT2529234.1 hypothetical protein [Streptomyces sp. ISL-99]
MSQPWQPQYNPGHQPPPMPQQAPGPPQGFGAPPPAPGQFPMQPGPPGPAGQPGHPGFPFPAPYGQPQKPPGSPAGAFFLGLLVSVVVATVYSFVMYATFEDQSKNTAQAMYVIHALLNGAAVGAVVGLVGRSRGGARICGAVVAVLGGFFGYTNGVVLIAFDSGWLEDMVRFDLFFPAKNWFGSDGVTQLIAVLALVGAAAAAWGLAYAIGKNRR